VRIFREEKLVVMRTMQVHQVVADLFKLRDSDRKAVYFNTVPAVREAFTCYDEIVLGG